MTIMLKTVFDNDVDGNCDDPNDDGNDDSYVYDDVYDDDCDNDDEYEYTILFIRTSKFFLRLGCSLVFANSKLKCF